jgi:hypothetical protein
MHSRRKSKTMSHALSTWATHNEDLDVAGWSAIIGCVQIEIETNGYFGQRNTHDSSFTRIVWIRRWIVSVVHTSLLITDSQTKALHITIWSEWQWLYINVDAKIDYNGAERIVERGEWVALFNNDSGRLLAGCLSDTHQRWRLWVDDVGKWRLSLTTQGDYFLYI